MLRIVDLSSWNKEVDMAAVAAVGIGGAIVKSSEGTGYRNPYYAQQVASTRAAGLVVGHYHYCLAGADEPDPEAEFFLSCEQLEPGEIVALDTEDPDVAPSRDLLSWTLTWLRHVEHRLGFPPFLYSAHYYLSPHNLEGHPALAPYPLWYASYQPTRPPTPPPWDRITLWQYTSAARLPGIGGNVDVSLFDGTVEEFKALGFPSAAKEDDMTEQVRTHLVTSAANLRGWRKEVLETGVTLERLQTIVGEWEAWAAEAEALAQPG